MLCGIPFIRDSELSRLKTIPHSGHLRWSKQPQREKSLQFLEAEKRAKPRKVPSASRQNNINGRLYGRLTGINVIFFSTLITIN